MKRFICIALSLFLAGCATEYQKKGFFGDGYQEMKLSDNSYLIEYQSNEFTSASMNLTHALHRAAELSKERGYKYFEILNTTDTSSTYTTPIVANTIANAHTSTYGTYGFGGFDAFSNGHKSSTTTLSGGDTFSQPGVTFIITMLKNKTSRSFDADAILSNYQK